MIHHHIGGGGQAGAVPGGVHNGYGDIHNVEKQNGIRNNDYLTDIGKTFNPRNTSKLKRRRKKEEGI